MADTLTDPVAGAGMDDSFRHEALFYAGMDGFVPAVATFLREGVERDEPALVVVSTSKVAALRDELGADSAHVRFADMGAVGANPARIIPAWHEFVADHPVGTRLRGVGEPIDATRTPDSLVECQRHESLLNLAFANSAAWWLVCPYDTEALEASVIDEAHASHPWVSDANGDRTSHAYRGLDAIAQPFDAQLPPPPSPIEVLNFSHGQLDRVRSYVAIRARNAGMRAQKISDLIVSVNEIATNSLRYGGGSGTLKVWQTAASIVCEVRDGGRLDQPLAGRRRPSPGQIGGFGVWLIHQLCDLVQMRTFADGSVVRLHMNV